MHDCFQIYKNLFRKDISIGTMTALNGYHRNSFGTLKRYLERFI